MSDATIIGADLQALQEITLPAPVSWLPQTVGWLVLLGTLLVIALALGGYQWRRWRANQYRRDALAELASIEARLQRDEPAALRELPALLKRTALCCAPRAQVAALTGDDWLHFLERTAPREKFPASAGQLLWRLAFAPDAALRAVPGTDRAALCELIRGWIRHHAAV